MNRAEKRRAQRAGKTSDPLALTWYSNAMWAPTGYGTQTNQAVPRIAADGHAVAVATNYGLEAMKTVYEGIPHYPQGVTPYSNDTIEPVFREWSMQHPDFTPLVLALFDAWPLKGPAWDRMPVGIWTMVDHLPCPPAVLEFLSKPNVLPLAASRFAHEQIQSGGVESLYVPMAIDTSVYKPSPTWTRDDGATLTGRQLMGFDEDVFVVSLINANKAGGGIHRKAWWENLQAFSIFAEGKDDVRLYLHTEKNGAFGGVKFAPMMEHLGIPAEKYRFVNQWAQHTGIPNEAMAALYTATDVLLASTLGEGFGLTVIEAAACETPAIVSDFTCQPELVSEDCYLVGGQQWWDSFQHACWQIPNVGEIVAALEAAYARGRFRSHAQRAKGLEYDADKVFAEHWRPALARLAEHAREHVQKRPAPRAVAAKSDDPAPEVISEGDPLRREHLTIYVPAYKRESLRDLLVSLRDQLTPDVEVIVADDDPDCMGRAIVREELVNTPATVLYQPRGANLGGDENLLRGLEDGSGQWIWMLGDDDAVLPGAVAAVLEAIEHNDVDRLILLSQHAPSGAAGMVGTPADLEAAQPGLTIAATLISANVVRRSALDVAEGRACISTCYGWAFAHTHMRRVKVLAQPCIVVGTAHGDEFISTSEHKPDIRMAWAALLDAYDVTPGDGTFSWNFVSVAA